jgi:hypothetical protein
LEERVTTMPLSYAHEVCMVPVVSPSGSSGFPSRDPPPQSAIADPHVSGPSTRSRLLLGRPTDMSRIRAARVRGPKSPSSGPAANPWRFRPCCSRFRSAP